MQIFQENLVRAWTDYAAGRIDEKTLKGQSAGFGIYQQRDLNAMMRVRRTGGIVSAADLTALAQIMRRFAIPLIHLTSRQDLQFHGVRPADVPAVLEACEAASFPFRGGGGDTFRNVIVSRNSGLFADSAFDVLPYARSLARAFSTYDDAYSLPRKLKIGFADRIADRALAQSQDLGFVARMESGRRVFEAYFAGGLGFKPRLGLKVFDALPAEDCTRLAVALVRLFREKGCRTNRAHARIRFLRDDFGDEPLSRMLRDAFATVTCEPASVGDPEVLSVPSLPPEPLPADAHFAVWRALCAERLVGSRFAVRLLVPFGNFTADELERLVVTLARCGITRYQIANSRDLVIAPVDESQLGSLYRVLRTALKDRDYTLKSYAGHVVTCIGGGVCRTGMCDSSAFGRAVAAELDRFLPADTPERLALARTVLDETSISGCPNGCTRACTARFGFICRSAGDLRELVPFVSPDGNAPGVLEPAAAQSVSATVAALAARHNA